MSAGKSVIEVMDQLLTDWALPREPAYLQAAKLSIRMPQRCSAERAERPLVLGERAAARIPDDLKEFWTAFSSAKLFEDVTYGQGGLEIFGYELSNHRTRQFNRERAQEARRGDRIIGRFIGDLDQLLIRCDGSKPDFGNIVVALRDGFRHEWYQAAASLAEFLQQYSLHEGQNYWVSQFQKSREES